MLEQYYGDHLNRQEETNAYDELRSAIQHHMDSCFLYGVTIEQAGKVLKAITNDCPQFFECMLVYQRKRQERNGVLISLSYKDVDRYRMERAKRKALDTIEKRIGRYGSDYLVAKCVYDYLAETVSGDDEPLEEYSRICSLENDEQRTQEMLAYLQEYGNQFTAYGALAEKKAVCMGVAMAYKLLMDELKIGTACVSGKVGEVNHMMNVVEIDGKCGFCDVTRGKKIENLPMIRYDYFLVSEKRICDYFSPDTAFSCETDELSYFHRNRLDFKSINSLRKYLNSFTYQATGGMLRCKFSNMGDVRKEVEELVHQIVIKRAGREYMITGYALHNGVLNCLIERRESTL